MVRARGLIESLYGVEVKPSNSGRKVIKGQDSFLARAVYQSI